MAVLVAIAVGGLMVKENVRHSHEAASIAAVKSELQKHGISPVDSYDRCPNAQEEFGNGPKYCSIGVETNAYVSPKQANSILNSYNTAIENTGRFKKLRGTEQSVNNFPGLDTFLENKTDRECSLQYDFGNFTNQTNNLFITFSCDDNSWFTNTFES